MSMSSNIADFTGINTMTISSRKWILSIIIGLIAVLIFSPLILRLTNSISQSVRGPATTTTGGITWWGLLLHFVVFVLLVRLLFSI